MRHLLAVVALACCAGPARAAELRGSVQSYVAADRVNIRRNAESLCGMIERRWIAFACGLFDGEAKP